LAIVTVPSTVLPSEKTTVPVAGAGTIAVKITGLPWTDGFTDDVRVMFATPFCPSVALVTVRVPFTNAIA
jgi:hypothetical protein